MNITSVAIQKPEDMNFILGHSHFIKTVEDLHEAIVQTVPQMKFGIAFCEASGPALLRCSGNDEALIELARTNGMALAAGHTFIIFMRDGFPVNILNTVKNVTEVCRIYCATANPAEVIICETGLGRAILGVVDGAATKGVESEEDVNKRKQFLRMIGYKAG
jgi:adenosine/AMP kinase